MSRDKMQTLNAVERIYRNYDGFTESNKILADFFLNNLEMATFKSVNELKTLTGVSDATVIRFAYEIGYSSFKEFREHLADYIRKILYSRMPGDAGQDPGDGSIDAVVAADINYIQRSMQGVNRERFACLVDLVCKAGTVYVMGWRISSFVAEFLTFQLQRIGYNVRAVVRERRPLLEQVLHIGEGDLLVVFDQIIYSTEVYDAVSYVKLNKPKVPIVTLTSDPLAQIVPHADISFFLDLGGHKDFSLISLSAPMCFVNSLIESVFARNPQKARAYLEKYEEIVLSQQSYAMLLAPQKTRAKRGASKKKAAGDESPSA